MVHRDFTDNRWVSQNGGISLTIDGCLKMVKMDFPDNRCVSENGEEGFH